MERVAAIGRALRAGGGGMNLNTFFHPRKTRKSRKSRKQSKNYFGVAGHSLEVDANRGTHLNMFVSFRAFRGHLGFLA
jgi:hypothetical protein